ncbi:MAG: Glu/Leu/Phe/Val dehydrogenase dimerization domain-containing protein, partial [Acidobacteriota bacterium]
NGVVVRHDRSTGAWILIALHDDTLGPSAGGTRMKVYPDLSDALLDVLRLAEGMTYKFAGVGLARGGGKAVLAIPRPLEPGEREGLLERYGELVESLRGAFFTGPDLGAGPDAMNVVARRTRNIFGIDPAGGASLDPGPFTARGVHAGLRAALEHVFGHPDSAGRSVLIEGLGDVGDPLARRLAEAGARLLLADLDAAKADRLARELGGSGDVEVIPLDAVPETPCDVYAPCAVGATVNADTIPRFRCRIVAGSANNQLREDADAGRLHRRGIVYVPDYIGNAGGAIAFLLLHEGAGRETIDDRVAAIEGSVATILREAAERDESPLAAARRRVDKILAEHRDRER